MKNKLLDKTITALLVITVALPWGFGFAYILFMIGGEDNFFVHHVPYKLLLIAVVLSLAGILSLLFAIDRRITELKKEIDEKRCGIKDIDMRILMSDIYIIKKKLEENEK